MRPVVIEPGEWPEGRPVVFGADQPEYEGLPALVNRDGVVVTRWRLSAEERGAILDGACIELAVLTFGRALQPVSLRVQGVSTEGVG